MFFRTLFSRELSIMKKRPAFYLTSMAALGALAFVLMLVQFPIFSAFPMLQFDFADVCVVVAAIMFGPISAVTVVLVKCLLFLPIDMGKTMGVGTLSNFICAFVFGITIAVVYHLRTIGGKQSPKRDNIFLAIALVTAVLLETGIAMLSNWFIIVPLFIVVWGDSVRKFHSAWFIFGGVLPFNLIKFTSQAVVAFVLMKALIRVLPKIVKEFKYKKAEAPPSEAEAEEEMPENGEGSQP